MWSLVFGITMVVIVMFVLDWTPKHDSRLICKDVCITMKRSEYGLD